MKINNIEMYTIDRIEEIYPGLSDSKLSALTFISKKGYLFFANNNQGIDMTQKWSKYNIRRAANSTIRKPRYLWAVMPLDEDNK